MNYKEATDYLYTTLPMYSRIGAAAYKKDLTNTLALCKALGDPHKKFKSIHIAGTNGKGSTASMITAVLVKAGYKTGLYTSPHLYDFRERIQISGAFISEEFVIDFVERTKVLAAEIQPSFFELTVAMAFDYFAQQQVDYAVIETGLGGRLDSTNVITPILSVITNIGYDHQNMLGDTLAEIAGEKAGIIKPGVPVVIGEIHEETRTIFEQKANKEKAEIIFVEEIYTAEKMESVSAQKFALKNSTTNNLITYQLDVEGNYQKKNLITAKVACEQLEKEGLVISKSAYEEGFANTQTLANLKMRWQVIRKNPLLIYDVSHNAAGLQQALSQLEVEHPNSNYHFVLGFVSDKDATKVLELFPKGAQYYFCSASIPRAMAKEDLQRIAAEVGLKGDIFPTPQAAANAALHAASKSDVILCCGSFFMIAELEQ